MFGAELNPAQAATLAALRDGPRPPVDGGVLAAELRDELEEALAPVTDEMEDGQRLVLYKSRLNDVHACTQRFVDTWDEPFEWSVPVVRGKVVHKAIELRPNMGGDATSGEMVAAAMERIAEQEGLGDFVAALSPGERAELEAEATAQLAAFEDGFPPIGRSWRPVFEGPMKVALREGVVQLYAKPDLMLGDVQRDGACTRVIVDHKTGNPYAGHRADLGFYALAHLLKFGVPPFRAATFYVDSALAEVVDITPELLWAAARRVADAAGKVAGLRSGRLDPTLSPGPACAWCGRRADCSGAVEWAEERERQGF